VLALLGIWLKFAENSRPPAKDFVHHENRSRRRSRLSGRENTVEKILAVLPQRHRFCFRRGWTSLRLRKGTPGGGEAPARRTLKGGGHEMFRKMSMALAATLLLAGAAYADPIEGNWKTQSGETAAIGGCGGGFCITLKTGKHAGKQIGKMNASGDSKYKGTITDPADDKTYSGSASLSGSSLNMTGCALKIFCKTQKWTKL
jgi:uncharacterized protein (DUF2147 family)